MIIGSFALANFRLMPFQRPTMSGLYKHVVVGGCHQTSKRTMQCLNMVSVAAASLASRGKIVSEAILQLTEVFAALLQSICTGRASMLASTCWTDAILNRRFLSRTI